MTRIPDRPVEVGQSRRLNAELAKGLRGDLRCSEQAESYRYCEGGEEIAPLRLHLGIHALASFI